MILADTTLLIDLQRGRKNFRRRQAMEWLSANEAEQLALPAIVFGEFAEGFEDPQHPILESYRTGFQIISVDVRVASEYGRLSRKLRAEGQSIGSNDTWIAATALAHACPVVTRNSKHLRRVPGLNVLDYAP
jgi:tRNA(fMet)-specific endonuclease VapC